MFTADEIDEAKEHAEQQTRSLMRAVLHPPPEGDSFPIFVEEHKPYYTKYKIAAVTENTTVWEVMNRITHSKDWCRKHKLDPGFPRKPVTSAGSIISWTTTTS